MISSILSFVLVFVLFILLIILVFKLWSMKETSSLISLKEGFSRLRFTIVFHLICFYFIWFLVLLFIIIIPTLSKVKYFILLGFQIICVFKSVFKIYEKFSIWCFNFLIEINILIVISYAVACQFSENANDEESLNQTLKFVYVYVSYSLFLALYLIIKALI